MRDHTGKICETYIEYDSTKKEHINVDTTRFLTFMEMVDATLAFADEGVINDLSKLSAGDLIDPAVFLGVWIRTNFGLWLEENPYTEYQSDISSPKHPEQLSLCIIKAACNLIKILQAAGTSSKAIHKSRPLEIV